MSEFGTWRPQNGDPIFTGHVKRDCFGAAYDNNGSRVDEVRLADQMREREDRERREREERERNRPLF